MSDVPSWKEGTSGEPKFPTDFEVVKKAVLQVTDIKSNKNKYYCVELHSATKKYRVYTHYGRTDDLDSNPNAGIRESRYYSSVEEAERGYNKIFAEKTSPRKGYKEVNLASSKIGSKQTIGKSSGEVDEKTLLKMSSTDTPEVKKSTIAKEIQNLVSYLYQEATNALTSTVNASITANGIETPLGVLTIGQIEKGQDVLDQLSDALQKKKIVKDDLIQLSGDFYTIIPHKFGRSKEQAELAIINDSAKLTDKQDTLQLMRDMLNVNSKGNVLVSTDIENKYNALNCQIALAGDEFDKIKTYVEKSVVRGNNKVKVKNVWKISRPSEVSAFTKEINNQKQLFHGSAIKNWVGILSRGLLLPKAVVKLGVTRTDAGWLGHGIYFGNASCTAAGYAHPGKNNTRFITVANVALGKIKQYDKITYGLTEPPSNYHSCHGVRGTQFADDEFVIYNHNQQKLEYLVECTYNW